MKKIKVALSLILALLLTSIMVLPAFAAAGEEKCDCGHAPVIQVRGIGETLYLGKVAEGNEIFSTDKIVNSILPVVPDLATFLLDTKNTDLFVDTAKTVLYDIFGPVMYNNNLVRLINLDSNGKEVSNPTKIVVNCSTDSVEKHEGFMASGNELTEEYKLAKALYNEFVELNGVENAANHVYLFTYDWTADPVKVAAELKDYIETVKKQSKHDKVSINAESMGGSIVNIYLDTYGYGSIENLVMANSAFNGLEMMAQIFTGNVNIDAEALTYLINQSILGNAELAELVPYLPVLEQIVPLVNDMMQDEETKARIYNEIFLPVFGYMPSFWSLVPTYTYDGHDKNVFDEAVSYLYGEDNIISATFNQKMGVRLAYSLTKIRNASLNTDDLVEEILKSTGEKLGVNSYANVTNYNSYIAPVTPSANWNSDGVIESYNTSGWATIADMGYVLGEDDIEKVDYVSPDNVIGISSKCQAPNNTWFIKNLGHVKYGLDDGVANFYVWLLLADDAYTVDTNAEYPQFMYYDTSIPELMTWEEKEANDADGGINLPTVGLPGLPDIDLDGLASALEQIIGGLGTLDLSALMDVLGMLGGVVGSLGDMLGGLLGGGETPAPEEPGDEGGEDFGDTPVDTPTETPSTDTDTNTNTNTNTNTGSSHVGSSNVNKVQNTGLVLSGNPVFSSGADAWIILFALATVIAGILIIKL